MASDADLVFTPAYELRRMIGEKEISPVELTESCLRRIERFNPKLNAFLTVVADRSLAEAKEAEQAVLRGDELGALHGIPVSIKDLEATEGIRTTKGSLIHKDWVPTRDQLVVERIRQAGAIVVGKTNTPEFGRLGLTENRLGDACRNPWDVETGAGGSSGGAAAGVAAGLTPIGQGSDGGGSIRIPAAFTGIFGIKGTQGRVPRHADGLASWHPVNFSCTGPLSRTVRDSAILLRVMAGPNASAEHGTISEAPEDYEAALLTGIAGLRMAYTADFGSAAVAPEVRETTERAAQVFAELGAAVEEAPFVADVSEVWSTYNTNARVRAAVSYGRDMDNHPDEITDYVRADIEGGRAVTAGQYFEALCALEQYRSYVGGFFTRFDVLLSPTLAVPAFAVGEPPDEIDGKRVDPRWGHYPFTFLFNMCGNPAASVPCGFSKDGLPIGLQIVCAKGEDARVLQVSAAFEAARPWADKRPPGFE